MPAARLRQRIATADTEPGTDPCAPPYPALVHTRNDHRGRRVLIMRGAAARVDAVRGAGHGADRRRSACRSVLRYDPAALEAEILRLYHAEGWRIGTMPDSCSCTTPPCDACSRRPASAPHSSLHAPLDRRAVHARSSTRPQAVSRRYARAACTHGARTRISPAARITSAHLSRALPAASRGGSVLASAHLRRRTSAVDWAHFGTITIGKRAAPVDGLRDGALVLAAPVPALLFERRDDQLPARPRRRI